MNFAVKAVIKNRESQFCKISFSALKTVINLEYVEIFNR